MILENKYSEILSKISYAQLLKIKVNIDSEKVIFVLPENEMNIGNSLIKALHGGAIAGFMETAGVAYLMVASDTFKFPKIINISIDYLRSGSLKDLFADCVITRQGNRVANVSVRCWHTATNCLIATSRMHFLL